MTALAVALLGLSAVNGMVNAPWAAASGKGRVTATAAVTSGTFGVEPVISGTSTLQPALAFTVISSGPQYFDALNTGTLSLAGTSYSVTFTYLGIGTPTVTLAGCSGGSWNQSTGVCSGTAVTIGSWTPGSTTVFNDTTAGSFPAAVGGRLGVKASIGGVSITATATVTVSSSVSTGATRQVRAATTTNV